MEVKKLLQGLGYNNLLSDKWYKEIAAWEAWYRGKTAFHRYWIYNGKDKNYIKRQSLGMAKKLCEDKADLLLNEKVNIYVSPVKESKENAYQDFLDEVLEDNSFWVNGNQLIELANALGTGAFVEYMDGDQIRIDFVNANYIYPLSWKNRTITECAFISNYVSGKNEKPLIYIQVHALNKQGLYVIQNKLFDAEGKPQPLPDDVPEELTTGRDKPLYQVFMPNIVNNIDPLNPMGISIYANCIDDLMFTDTIYDSYKNEFDLGKKRIFVNDSVVKPDPETGDIIPVFDPHDTVFYGLPLGDGTDQGKKAIVESNMALRVQDHKTALQDALDVLSDKTGFGKGYYKFDADGVKTATEIISQNSKLYRKIKKDEIILDKTLTDLAKAILFLGGYQGELVINVAFDDSIVEDTQAIANRAHLEYTSDLIDKVEYFIRVYNMTEEAAIAHVKNMESRKGDAPPPPDDEEEGEGA